LAETSDINPDPAPTFIASSNGVQIAVHDLGGPDDPTATVLLFSHATGLHGRVWQPLANELVAHYRCIALDYRGHGLSETPSEDNLAWPHMGDDAVAVVESELIGPGRTLHGIGHSMGGAALALAASRRPSRFRSLWLYEPVIVPPGALPPFDVDLPNPMAEAASRRRATFASYEQAVTNFAGKAPLNQLRPDALAAYVAGGFALQPGGSVALRCLPSTEAAVFRKAGTSGVWEVVAALDLPVAVVAGREDGMGPVGFAPSVVASLRRGTLFERRHLGHFGPLEDPTGMARDVVAWVRANQ
jgi:pimeloyl-ACP methyl ester carboxylesterase